MFFFFDYINEIIFSVSTRSTSSSCALSVPSTKVDLDLTLLPSSSFVDTKCCVQSGEMSTRLL